MAPKTLTIQLSSEQVYAFVQLADYLARFVGKSPEQFNQLVAKKCEETEVEVPRTIDFYQEHLPVVIKRLAFEAEGIRVQFLKNDEGDGFTVFT